MKRIVRAENSIVNAMLATILACSLAQGQPVTTQDNNSSSNRAHVEVVVNSPVSLDLKENDFALKIGKQNVPVVAVAVKGVPIVLGIMVDVSGSMSSDWKSLRTGLAESVDSIKSFSDSYGGNIYCFINTFNGVVHPLTPITATTTEEVKKTIASTPLSRTGGTYLYGAAVATLKEFKKLDADPNLARAKRALILITDGEDNESYRQAYVEATKIIEEEGIQVYVLATQGSGFLTKGNGYVYNWMGIYKNSVERRSLIDFALLEKIDRKAKNVSDDQYARTQGTPPSIDRMMSPLRSSPMETEFYYTCGIGCSEDMRDTPFWGARELEKWSKLSAGSMYGLLEPREGMKAAMPIILYRLLYGTYRVEYDTQNLNSSARRDLRIQLSPSSEIKQAVQRANLRLKDIEVLAPSHAPRN